MAKRIKLDQLDNLKERKDKLVSRLFMKKLEILLEKEKNYLYKCAYCQKLFTKEQRKVLSCQKGNTVISYNGQIRAKHVIDREWDLKKFITYIRETYRISWKEIYWKVWSYLYIMKCNICQDFFHISEMGSCRSHAGKAKVKYSFYGSQQISYEYDCCKQSYDIQSFLGGRKTDQGCILQMHSPEYGYGISKEKEKMIL